MSIIPILLFSVVLAFVVAKLEIQIEGKAGWAKNLPTFRFKNFLTRIFIGNRPLTGYHLWLITLMVVYAHLIFLLGISWNIALELRILGIFFLAAVLEDFFWFVLNPAYGLKKFTPQHISWHSWLGNIPHLYISFSAAAIVCFVGSYLL